jgi:hypothetical protein
MVHLTPRVTSGRSRDRVIWPNVESNLFGHDAFLVHKCEFLDYATLRQ